MFVGSWGELRVATVVGLSPRSGFCVRDLHEQIACRTTGQGKLALSPWRTIWHIFITSVSRGHVGAGRLSNGVAAPWPPEVGKPNVGPATGKLGNMWRASVKEQT